MTSPSTRNLDARGVDRAQELLARYYEPYDITPLGDADDFHLRIRSVDVGSLSLVNVRYGSVVHIAATQRLQDAYCVSQVCAGGLQLSSGHDAVDLGPGESSVADEQRLIGSRRLADTDVTLLRMELCTVRRTIADLLGSTAPTARFTMAPPHSRADRARWQATVAVVASATPTAGANALYRDGLERFVVSSLLATHPNTFVDPPPSPVPSTISARSAMAAAEYLQAHHAEPIRVWKLAEQLHVTSRTLQLGFKSVYGMSISQYVRGLRLDSAHQQLISDAEPSVADVAYRWGFSSPSRFARAYREHFGVTPSRVERPSTPSPERLVG